MEIREKVVAEIMTLVRPQPKRLPKPTIEELERILNSETTDAVNIEPDGSVSITPTVTTVGAVADAVMRIVDAELQNRFDLGYKAAGGTVTPIVSVPTKA